MKIVLFTGFLFFVAANSLIAQQSVWDISAMECLIAEHKSQYDGFLSMKNSEAELLVINTQIKDKLDELKVLEDKFHNMLVSVDMILRNAQNVVYIYNLSQDVVNFQKKMISYVFDDPKLAVIGAQTELELIRQTKKLMEYLIIATTGGDVNLLNNKQRTDIINHIIIQLKIMRGTAYIVCSRLEFAKRYGFKEALKYINFNKFFYAKEEQKSKLVTEILNGYNSKRIKE